MVQFLLHTQQFFALAFHHARNRDPRPTRQHFSNFGIGHFITQQTHSFAFELRCGFQLLFQFRDFAVLQFRHPRQVTHTASLFNSDFRLFQFRFNGLRTRKRGFLCFPLFF